MLFLQAITAEALDILKFVQERPEFSRTRLVGGTALALQIGHRLSVDLDFFGDWELGVDIQGVLSKCGRVRQESMGENIRAFTVSDTRVDFVRYPYGWLAPPIQDGGFRLASFRDLAPMKLSAICNRGSRKDFIDIAFLLEITTLDAMLEAYRQKFPDGSEFMVLKSLNYFADAETDPMPTMLRPLAWQESKDRIRQALRGVA